MFAEAFVVCQHFCIPEGFQPANLRGLLQNASDAFGAEQHSRASRLLVPFMACGDLSGASSVWHHMCNEAISLKDMCCLNVFQKFIDRGI